MDEVAECPSVREGTAEVLDRHTVDGADGAAPLEEESEGPLKEDVGLKRGPTRINVLGGYGVWLCLLEDVDLLLNLLLVELELNLSKKKKKKEKK